MLTEWHEKVTTYLLLIITSSYLFVVYKESRHEIISNPLQESTWMIHFHVNKDTLGQKKSWQISINFTQVEFAVNLIEVSEVSTNQVVVGAMQVIFVYFEVTICGEKNLDRGEIIGVFVSLLERNIQNIFKEKLNNQYKTIANH